MADSPETPVCPDCGAPWRDGKTCRDRFEEMLALEFTTPEAGEVHHLTVACYMIQHNLYSEEGRAWIMGMLEASLERGIPPHEIRRQNRAVVDSGQRTWKITGSAGKGEHIAWPLTIADAYTPDLTVYAERVRAWARAVLDTLRAR